MEKRALTIWMPEYEEARHLISLMVGSPHSVWRSMYSAINAKWKSPELKGKWTDPDAWIDHVLSGNERELARRISRETQAKPYNAEFTAQLVENHQLVAYPDDIVVLTDMGRRFVNGEESTIAKIDKREGILVILADIAQKGAGRQENYLPAFREFFLAYTTYSAKYSGLQALRRRLRNLEQRELVKKRGSTYQVTESGLAYLSRWDNRGTRDFAIEALAENTRNATRRQLAEFLQSMDPIHFERLIKLLLEKMDYENVEVTPAGNDKGVDVVADKEFGISRVREAIQVKQQKSNIGRPVLDSLRGSLHRFDAVTATVITTSGYTKAAIDAAFEKGAAPITLIDGERLIDLLIEHDIGIRRSEIKIMEFDHDSLSQFEPDTDLDA